MEKRELVHIEWCVKCYDKIHMSLGKQGLPKEKCLLVLEELEVLWSKLVEKGVVGREKNICTKAQWYKKKEKV